MIEEILKNNEGKTLEFKEKFPCFKEAAILWNVTVRTAHSRLIKLIDAGIVGKTGTALKDPYSNYVLVDK
jgi:hypothetical protein